jgi:hypothetical protein
MTMSVFGYSLRFRVVSQEVSRNDLPVRVELVGPNEILVVISRTFNELSFPGAQDAEISSLEVSMIATALLFHSASNMQEFVIGDWESEYAKIMKKFAHERPVLERADS